MKKGKIFPALRRDEYVLIFSHLRRHVHAARLSTRRPRQDDRPPSTEFVCVNEKG